MRFALDAEDRKRLIAGEDLYVGVMTYGHPMQPFEPRIGAGDWQLSEPMPQVEAAKSGILGLDGKPLESGERTTSSIALYDETTRRAGDPGIRPRSIFRPARPPPVGQPAARAVDSLLVPAPRPAPALCGARAFLRSPHAPADVKREVDRPRHPPAGPAEDEGAHPTRRGHRPEEARPPEGGERRRGHGFVKSLRAGGEYGDDAKGMTHVEIQHGPDPVRKPGGPYKPGPPTSRLHVPTSMAKGLRIGGKVHVALDADGRRRPEGRRPGRSDRAGLMSAALLAALVLFAYVALYQASARASRAEHRVTQLEQQLDELRARALGTPMPEPYQPPTLRALVERTRAPLQKGPAPLPDAIVRALAGIEDVDAREEFEQAARAILAERPTMAPEDVMDEVFS